jgi:type I restriction enzyme S subunit
MKFTTLNHLCYKVGDGLHGTPVYDAEGTVPFINGNNLKNGKVSITESTQYIHDSEVDKHYIDLSGDDTLLLQINGTIGNMAFYNNENIILGKSAAYLRFKNPVDRVFCYYYLQLPNVVKGLYNIATGSTIKNLGLGHIKSFKIFDFPDTKKKNIANVLSTLDTKIDLNNRINAELESLARTIYDYWFLQFDFPDGEGRPSRSSGGEMRFDEGLGLDIPAGWKSGTAKDFISFNPTERLPKGSMSSYIDMGALPITGYMTDHPARKEFSGGMKFRNEDVLVARITPCLENGKTCLVTQLEDNEIGFGSTEFIVMRGLKESIPSYISLLARSDFFRKYAIQNMTGTSGRKRVDSKQLEVISLPVPPADILLAFEKVIKPMFEKMAVNAKENYHLSSLRDWLLPLLMSGEVVVGE